MGKTKLPLSNIDEVTAQAELNGEMFSHYILGRCLAMEEVLKEVLKTLPAKRRAEIAGLIVGKADDAMRELPDDVLDTSDDVKRHVTKCGFIHTLLMQGF